MAYDEGTRQLILESNPGAGCGSLATTWSWNGTTWVKLIPPTGSPTPVGLGISMAYDKRTRQLVLFMGAGRETKGGVLTCVSRSTTWTWSGTAWTKLTPKASPPGRMDGHMAYDAATGQLVLFGGTVVSTGPSRHGLTTTWSWNGTAWTKLSSKSSPPRNTASTRSSMAYDTATRQLVLFWGHWSDYIFYNTTWTWNGTTWTKRTPKTSPTTRSGTSMAYDPAIRQLILFGGSRTRGTPHFLSTTWAWTGTTWTKVSSLRNATVARASAQMAYDTATRQLIRFGGGNGAGNPLRTTWVLVATKGAG